MLIKERKAIAGEMIVKVALWIVFFVLAGYGMWWVFQRLTQ